MIEIFREKKSKKNYQQQKSVNKFGVENFEKSEDFVKEQITIDMKKMSVENQELKDFFKFCKNYLSQKNQKLGMIYEYDKVEQQAFSLLKQNNYDYLKAKYYIIFPLKYALRFSQEISRDEMEKELREYRSEKSIFKDKLIVGEVFQMINAFRNNQILSQEEVEIVFKKASNNKMGIPQEIQQEYQQCYQINEYIKQLQSQQKISIKQVQELHQKSQYLKIKPHKFQWILQILNQSQSLKTKLQEIYMTKEFFNVDHIVQVKNQISKTKFNFDQIVSYEWVKNKHSQCIQFYRITQLIVNGQISSKIKMQQLCELIVFFTKNQSQKSKLLTKFLNYINECERHKNICMMFLEDNKNLDNKSITFSLNKIKNCVINYSDFIHYVEMKIFYLKALKSFQKYQFQVDYLQTNYQLSQKIKSCQFQIETEQIQFFIKNYQIMYELRLLSDQLNQISLSIFDFLFSKVNLVKVNHVQKLIYDLDPEARNNILVQKFQSYLMLFYENLQKIMQTKEDNLKVKLKKLNLLINMGLDDEKNLWQLKKHILNQVLIYNSCNMFINTFIKNSGCDDMIFDDQIIIKKFESFEKGLNFFMQNQQLLDNEKVAILQSVYTNYSQLVNLANNLNNDLYALINLNQEMKNMMDNTELQFLVKNRIRNLINNHKSGNTIKDPYGIFLCINDSNLKICREIHNNPKSYSIQTYRMKQLQNQIELFTKSQNCLFPEKIEEIEQKIQINQKYNIQTNFSQSLVVISKINRIFQMFIVKIFKKSKIIKEQLQQTEIDENSYKNILLNSFKIFQQKNLLLKLSKILKISLKIELFLKSSNFSHFSSKIKGLIETHIFLNDKKLNELSLINLKDKFDIYICFSQIFERIQFKFSVNLQL